MAETDKSSIFVDTSIQIARRVHRPEIQRSIAKRLKGRSSILSGLIVRQEFKRRLLKEALYLLKQFELRKSYQAVMRHVTDSLPPQQSRKKNICLDVLQTVDEWDDDNDRSDRARLFLRDLIKNGLATAEAHLTAVVTSSGCACAMQPIIEKKKFEKYDMGGDRCANTTNCGIRKFLNDNKGKLIEISAYLERALREESETISDELKAANEFIKRFLADPEHVERANPCLTVGDLLVAIESLGCHTVYTMNHKESRHLRGCPRITCSTFVAHDRGLIV